MVASSGFSGFTENIFKTAAIGLGIVWLVTTVLQQFDVIQSEIKVGLGVTILAIGLGLMAAYMLIIKKEFRLEKMDYVSLVLALAVVVGAVYFLPKLLPDLYSIGVLQVQAGVQSIFGIG